MSWREASRQREDLKRLHNAGYADGLKGKPAVTKDATYQVAWRRGQERRRDLLLNDLDDAS